MPIYEYRCERGHTFEVMQRISEDALANCTACEAPVRRVFHSPAVHFKGSGFYATDYAKRGAKTGDEAKADGAKSDSDSDSSAAGSSDSSGSSNASKTSSDSKGSSGSSTSSGSSGSSD